MPSNRIPESDSRAEAPAESALHCPPGPISELQAHRHFSGIPISGPTKATVDKSMPAILRKPFPSPFVMPPANQFRTGKLIGNHFAEPNIILNFVAEDAAASAGTYF